VADGEDWSWLDAIANTGFDAGDLGGDLFFNTDTGEFLDASMVDPASVTDLDLSGSGSGPIDFGGTGALDTSPVSTSTSDQLRSLQADASTPGTEPFNAANMADPSASIASASGLGSGEAKALASGLADAFKPAAGGLAGLANAGIGALTGLPGIPGLTNASLDRAGTPGMGGMTDAGGLPGLQGLVRPGMQDPVTAALMRLQADPGARLGLQAPVDPGPPPVKFTPLQMPVTGPMPTMAGAPAPRMSGLQRLALERMG